MADFLSLPLKLRDGFFRRCELEESIRHSVALIIATRKGQVPFNREYGSGLWEKEYADLYAAHKSDIQTTLRNAITQFEPRLFNLGAALVQNDKDASTPGDAWSVRVTGSYRDGDEEKQFEATYSLTE